jgi:hypothetical protein
MFTKKSGDSFSMRNTERSVGIVIWTKSLSKNPYKLIFFEAGTEPGKSGTGKHHVQVSSNGTLRIASLNILDQGDLTRVIVDDRGCCVKQTRYQLEIEQSEAEGRDGRKT